MVVSAGSVITNKNPRWDVPVDFCPLNAGNIIMGEVRDATVITNTFDSFDENISVSDFYIQTSGLYLLSERLSDDGEIINVRAFGHLSDANLRRAFDIFVLPQLFIVVFRHDEQSGSYRLIHEPKELTHTVSPGILPADGESLNWPVRRGDRIGAVIPNSCLNVTEEFIKCPSQINLLARADDCLSALYHPFNTDTGFEGLGNIPDDQFDEVQVKLNMEVLISPNG